MDEGRWLVEVARGRVAADHVLYIVPHAGAGVSAVRTLGLMLRGRVRTMAVRLPGREARQAENPVDNLDLLAERLTQAIADDLAGRRAVLYGHCSGSVLAYETACLLPPAALAQLAVSAHQAPDAIPTPGSWELPQDQFLAQVQLDGYIPAQVLADPELVALVMPALRADYRAIETHTSRLRVLSSPVLALVGRNDHAVAVAEVARWGGFTNGTFRLEELDGGHNLLLEHAEAVAAALTSSGVRL